jgi:hypothetical protein
MRAVSPSGGVGSTPIEKVSALLILFVGVLQFVSQIMLVPRPLTVSLVPCGDKEVGLVRSEVEAEDKTAGRAKRRCMAPLAADGLWQFREISLRSSENIFRSACA